MTLSEKNTEQTLQESSAGQMSNRVLSLPRSEPGSGFHIRRMLLVVCSIMIACWWIWWAFNIEQRQLIGHAHLWVPTNWGLGIGCDFYNHVDHPARIWWNEGDPYADRVKFFPYPPSEMRLFFWVNYFSPRTALTIWLIAMAAILAAAARKASLWRRRLDLEEIPPVVAVALILFSFPALFAIERGQIDPLSLLFLLAALPLLHHSSKWSSYLAGVLLCLTPWVKAYPGLIFIGLIGLKRWRALAAFCFTGMVIAAYFLFTGEMQNFLANNAEHIQRAENLALAMSGTLHPWTHPLSTGLASLWLGTKFGGLGLLPAKMLSGTLLLSALAWVTYHIYKCPEKQNLTYPYLLWIISLATFFPPISNDYNLVFLPLAVIAVWSRHDPVPVQAAMASLLIWWQPFLLPINGNLLLGIKVIGLGAVAVCLVIRANHFNELCLKSHVNYAAKETNQ